MRSVFVTKMCFYPWRGVTLLAGLGFLASSVHAQQDSTAHALNLPTSKQLIAPIPGDPQRTNSLPISLAVSPDHRWVVSLNAGFGTFESGYMQSLGVLDTRTGNVRDFPDARTLIGAKQTFFSGIAFSADGTKIYASLASSSDPKGDGNQKTGNGIVVYKFADGVPTPDRFLRLPPVTLADGRHTSLPAGEDHTVSPFPAALAVVPGETERLLVAENLSDTVAVLDTTSGALVRRFDLSVRENVPATYPIALAVTKDGKRAFVALWNVSEVVELDLAEGGVARSVRLMKPSSATAPGTHPCALLLDERAGLLYVALSNRDAVAAIDIGKSNPAGQRKFEVRGYFDTRLPGQSYFGAEPSALAENEDGSRLYAANLGSDAVAVLDPRALLRMSPGKGMVEPIGFVPTELMPMALASVGRTLYVASAKGRGTGPNDMAPRPTDATKDFVLMKRSFTYGPTLLYGSLATLNQAAIESELKASTAVVLESNRMKAAREMIQFAGGGNPIKHVIYILKENRTYDQVFGDLAKDGKRVGNGDAALTMYGAATTPNQHLLALQFGVLDNFFDSGEVSGDGHVWSTAGIGTDFVEKTWQLLYRSEQRTYDYEGMVADGYPLLQHIPDIAEPASGYLWTNFASHGKTIYHFAEYISSIFCDDKKLPRRVADPTLGAMSGSVTHCASPTIKPGEAIPEEWGGGKNLWPWAIPRLAANIATKPELVGHFAPEAPDFNLRVPDQIRANVFLRHLEQWIRDRAAGNDTMPNYIQLRLPDDHTEGTKVGGPTPKSSVADNDLAVGRVVEAISHSAFWNDTAIMILEDDAQNGGDHVDAHRSLAIVVSKYAPHPKADEVAVVDSRFYSTVSMLRTMETLLQVPPMNNNDAFCSLISTPFTGPGDQPAFVADVSNRDNGLIYMANAADAVGAAQSEKMDFRHADRADPSKLNLILWQDAMGGAQPPPMLTAKHKKMSDNDD
ncbi:MAG: phosphoesterase [Pseudomonadota bacterium]|nr:phosphoesterase [Pseudomonadota bacterium]